MRDPRLLYAAFTTSGVAGLVYEVLWSRYLGLYVGHGAYAQVLVLAVYLGGMAVGAAAVSRLTQRLVRPLLWYAGAEAVLALFGLVFHPLFVAATDLSYDVLFPALGSAALVGSVRWAVAGALILPQAIVLGATFPLMAAGLVRADATRPGRGVALAYLLNTLGGAAGVLLAGFWLIGTLGFAGTSIAAAFLNLLACAAVWLHTRAEVRRREPAGEAPVTAAPTPAMEPPHLRWLVDLRTVGPLLIVVAFGTALASFAYEIGWIRMLSLVLGSATHAFELMLSAFILGLAFGAWLIRDHVDRTGDPLRLLGTIQLLMGVTALLSLPAYVLSFDVMALLVGALPGRAGGWALFNASRYALCLLVMLPATTLAGMTLPVITGSLLRAGSGEEAVGRVYAVNTVGCVAGAGLAGLFALPLLGLERLLLAGAAFDAFLGLWVLERSARHARSSRLPVAASLVGTAAVFLLVAAAVELDPSLLTSGVYRTGDLSGADDNLSLYYQDGRTATVSAHIGRSHGSTVLATNGKPDASLGPLWRVENRDTLPPRPIPLGSDFTTQFLSPLVSLAHRPQARTIANIGHGSGMSAVAFLTHTELQRLVTIEIEPLMVEGSLVFLPTNAPAFNDPRSTFVFDDAKSFFAYRQERFDIIFAEPSNPWVSGNASLFTKEFYERATDFLVEGGLLAQWIQIYELNDDLLLSVLAALDAVFPSYRGYLVGEADVAVVARRDGPVGEPDWSVLDNERVRSVTAGIPPFTASSLEATLLFDETTLAPLLRRGVRPNSYFRPVLDVGAERARFDQEFAVGTYELATSRVDLARALRDVSLDPAPYSLPPSRGLASTVLWARAAWLREALSTGGGIAPEEFPEWDEPLVRLRTFLDASRGVPPLSWQEWADAFGRLEADLHIGTRGWLDSTFYAVVDSHLARAGAPAEAQAAVDLAKGYALGDWERVATAADRLVSRVAAGERWADPRVLLDMAVLGYVRTGRASAARVALELLVPRTGRPADHLRHRLLRALVEEAEVTTRETDGRG